MVLRLSTIRAPSRCIRGLPVLRSREHLIVFLSNDVELTLRRKTRPCIALACRLSGWGFVLGPSGCRTSGEGDGIMLYRYVIAPETNHGPASSHYVNTYHSSAEDPM